MRTSVDLLYLNEQYRKIIRPNLFEKIGLFRPPLLVIGLIQLVFLIVGLIQMSKNWANLSPFVNFEPVCHHIDKKGPIIEPSLLKIGFIRLFF